MQLLMNKLIYPKVFWKLYDQDEKIITITKPQDPESDYTFELGETLRCFHLMRTSGAAWQP